jgi:thymidine kinase
VLCWCGQPGQLNARVIDGRVVREGDTVVVGDTGTADPNTSPDDVGEVRYQVLCRVHHRRGDLGGDVGRGQLALDV